MDLFIAEVSYCATGLGIELGWASDDNIPIYYFYKKGIIASSFLKSILSNIVGYDFVEQLSSNIEKIVVDLNKLQNRHTIK